MTIGVPTTQPVKKAHFFSYPIAFGHISMLKECKLCPILMIFFFLEKKSFVWQLHNTEMIRDHDYRLGNTLSDFFKKKLQHN